MRVGVLVDCRSRELSKNSIPMVHYEGLNTIIGDYKFSRYNGKIVVHSWTLMQVFVKCWVDVSHIFMPNVNFY